MITGSKAAMLKAQKIPLGCTGFLLIHSFLDFWRMRAMTALKRSCGYTCWGRIGVGSWDALNKAAAVRRFETTAFSPNQ